jgi:hypothetical protein
LLGLNVGWSVDVRLLRWVLRKLCRLNVKRERMLSKRLDGLSAELTVWAESLGSATLDSSETTTSYR